MYQNRYYVGTFQNSPAVYDTKLGLRAFGGTAESMHDLMVGLAKDDAWFEKNPASDAPLVGGQYEAGLTSQEYTELHNEWLAEQADIQAEYGRSPRRRRHS